MALAKLGQGFTQRLGAALLATTLMGGALFALAPDAAQAQNMFAPRLYVNGEVITQYEVAQRQQFLQVLNAPGNNEAAVLKTLTDERLQRAFAKGFDISLTDAEISAGMEEFAARGQMTAAALIGELQSIGIAPETYRDYISAGLLWRQVIQARFAGQINVSNWQATRYLEGVIRPRALKVKLSELVIPMPPGEERAVMELANRLSESIDSAGEFAAAARQYSAAPSGANGGVVGDWLPLSNLPASIAAQILALGEGQASQPIVVPDAVVLFLLRDIARDESAKPDQVIVEWAEYLVPNQENALAELKTSVDTCNDLHALANKNGTPAIAIHRQSMGEIAQDVGLELAKLDAGEISTTLTRGDARRAIMLCGREPVVEGEISPEAVKEQVVNQKLEGLAENFMEELRHSAVIRQP